MEKPEGFEGSVDWAFENQIAYCDRNGASVTRRIVAGLAALLVEPDPGAFVTRIRDWSGPALEQGLPLRAAGALHGLHLSGKAPALAPIYAGERADDLAVLREVVRAHAADLLPWLDGPPQTNEAGRSANFVAAMLWLAGQGLPPRFECLEIGSSAGINLMIDRYGYDVGGVKVGPSDPVMELAPAWAGAPPPDRAITILPPAGCDIAPVDLTDPVEAMRLKAFVWPEHAVRFARIEAAIGAATQRAPDLVKMPAADFVEERLACPQAEGTTRVLMHSIVWQYLPEQERARISAAMENAGKAADAKRALAWIAVEADRTLMNHALKVRFWPGGAEARLLAGSHAHGAAVEWMA